MTETLQYRADPQRIQAFLQARPDIKPIATNEQIQASPFYIPIVYQEQDREHVVYFQDTPWDEPAIQRLLEWTLALRFFSSHAQAIVDIDSETPTPLVQEIVSLHPIPIAKLSAIIGVLIVDRDDPETLVGVARKWLEELFEITWPTQSTTQEENAEIDRTVMMLNYLIEKHFWNEGQWHFHPLEYIVLLSIALGDLIRLRHDGQWITGDQPTEHRVRCFGTVDVHPLTWVIDMLQRGPDASVWERYHRLPIEWAMQQFPGTQGEEPEP